VFVRPCTDNCRPVRRLAEQIQVGFPPRLVRRGRHPMFRARQGNFFPCSMGSAVKSRWWPSSRSLRHVQCQGQNAWMFYEEEEGEGREVREGGTSERERATILSIERETIGPAQIRGGEGGGGRKGGKRKGVLWRNQKTRRGGTSERERETILSTKAVFPTSKGGFLFCNSVSYFG